MIYYNGQVLPLCSWPAVHFSSTILLNLKINVCWVKWLCTCRCWMAARRPSRQGAMLVPNSCLARGNGLSVCAVLSCVQTMVWLPVFGGFNACTDVNACDCTWGLYGHCKGVCTERWLWENNPLPYQRLKPSSMLRPAPSLLNQMIYQWSYSHNS